MNANELMKYDWVMNDRIGVCQVIGLPREVKDYPIEITVMYPAEGFTEIRNIGEHYIQPIPLTPKILEKNGFERRKETRVDCYDLRQDKASVYLEIKDRIEHEWLCVIGRHYPTSWRCRLELRVHEVHELQHALRLAGINKEIVL